MWWCHFVVPLDDSRKIQLVDIGVVSDLHWVWFLSVTVSYVRRFPYWRVGSHCWVKVASESPFQMHVKLCLKYWMALCFVLGVGTGLAFLFCFVLSSVDSCPRCVADLWRGDEPAGQVEGLAQHPWQPRQHRAERDGADRPAYHHRIHPAAALTGQRHSFSPCTSPTAQTPDWTLQETQWKGFTVFI